MEENTFTKKTCEETKKGQVCFDFTGFENHESAQKLQEGLTGKIIGVGNSMTPILKSHQPVICEPVTEETELNKRDIVLCKVGRNHYLHLIWSVKPGDRYLIGNNHGHANGVISRKNIYGRVIEIL